MIVGESWSHDDIRFNMPFSGSVGQELNRMLHEAGIMRSECYTTCVCDYPIPFDAIAKAKKDITLNHHFYKGMYVTEALRAGCRALAVEIDLVQPNLIIAMGSVALWALTDLWSVPKWRGSLLYSTHPRKPKVIPTYHPSAIYRQWDLRAIAVNDLKRAKRHMTTATYDNKPEWQFQVRPSFDSAIACLNMLLARVQVTDELWLDFDIETRYEHIDCIGISWSRTEAICIPFVAQGRKEGYWNLDEETVIIFKLYKLLTHKNCRVRWQNGLYDAQYVYRHWHFLPHGGQDTMISQHSLFCAMPKGLDFIASMYCDWYVYWKDEGKIASNIPEEQRWTYNLQDCIYTREAGEVLQQSVKVMGLAEVDSYQQRMFNPVLRAMRLGVRIRPEVKATMAMDIQEELSHREAFLYNVVGHAINPKSPKQMQAFFYEDMAQPKILKRVVRNGHTTMSASCDDESMAKISAREPLLKPICNAILDIRTLYKFLKDFVMMPLDTDGRMRCSFNIAGDAGGKSAPYSYRLSSSKNPFGSGGNLQTIPSEKSKSSGKAAARGSMDFTLPNIRSMYGPDQGFTFFDMDLDRADLQVVVWESGDPMLKAALRMGADIHLLNTYGIDNKEPPPLEELVETHPRYLDHKSPRKHKREFAKVFCHATNYLGKAKTVAAHTGRGVHEIDQAQKRWFAAHPGILEWHQRVTNQVREFRYVENKFGYRWYVFDRIDENLLPAAVAWIPQSTVGIVINRAWLAFYENIPEVQVLLQVHDSLAGQFPTHRRATLLPLMERYSKIVIPYDEPLIIPTGIKTSTISWGDCV
jgi:DNA polymerase I-like protein with 3'-5' exonuclease and polymerase domains/uracil-DNA glycosylase